MNSKLCSPEIVSDISAKVENIRNICILAHVDHGKTTLADSLLATNGIISSRLAGKVRYMDSRTDEQERGITMKSSAASIIHKWKKQLYLINIIDSPGHVDFSSEVSTAVRLSDGALLIVDVVEGVCAQTVAVLKQASIENLKLILVFNKIDRLILEMKLTAEEAYSHLCRVLEHLNATIAEQFSCLAIQGIRDRNSIEEMQALNWDEFEDGISYFDPLQTNVIFASGLDTWGFKSFYASNSYFSIETFAKIFSRKFDFKEEILSKTLWGDFYFNKKTKSVMKGAQKKGMKPLFVQFILDNIWQIYMNVNAKDAKAVEKVAKSLNIEFSPNDLEHLNPHIIIQKLFSQWIPMAECILDSIIANLPHPGKLNKERVKKLLCSPVSDFDHLPVESQKLLNSFIRCSGACTEPIIICVPKFFGVEEKSILEPKMSEKTLSADELMKIRIAYRENWKSKMAGILVENAESSNQPLNSIDSVENSLKFQFLGFARIFSGTITCGQNLWVLWPRHDPSKFENMEAKSLEDIPKELREHVGFIKVEKLFLMMGREFLPLNHVSAGNVFAFKGITNIMAKSAVLSDTLLCPSFGAFYSSAASSIVNVAIEPVHLAEMEKLKQGMKFLNQSDPSVEIKMKANGEIILCASGEVHLERCIRDLKESFAGIEIRVSEPTVPFRETLVSKKFDMVQEIIAPNTSCNKVNSPDVLEDGVIQISNYIKTCTLQIRALPIPAEVVDILEKHSLFLKSWKSNPRVGDDMLLFKQQLCHAFKNKNQPLLNNVTDKIWSFGPHGNGTNILINAIDGHNKSFWSQESKNSDDYYASFDDSIINGFQLATAKGPLCDEEMSGVCFFLEKCEVHAMLNTCDDTIISYSPETISEKSSSILENSKIESDQDLASLSGQIVYLMKEGCRRAFMAWPHRRLMVAMYKCDVQCPLDSIGRIHSIVNRRQGRVMCEDMISFNYFLISAAIPVIESFGFANEVWKATSGTAAPQLFFSHWETFDIDPLWEPSTEEEYVKYGEKADFENRARFYMNLVRKRKGLKVNEIAVQHAEKQRTLTKNK